MLQTRITKNNIILTFSLPTVVAKTYFLRPLLLSATHCTAVFAAIGNVQLVLKNEWVLAGRVEHSRSTRAGVPYFRSKVTLKRPQSLDESPVFDTPSMLAERAALAGIYKQSLAEALKGHEDYATFISRYEIYPQPTEVLS